ncbi:TIR domain-containing adapter molecule 1 [Pagrus major]|uniref:TIR domain-containing adapter molecule 1 n=1 Tax=Pagrus major TaxID=143350 RepID=UPI003CC8C152
MSHTGEENPGTGLRDAFDLLVKAPQQRLISLTLLLGESPEDTIVHALCLMVLQREAEAMNKLQALGDNYLAKHLAEKWQMSEGKLEDFAVHCGNFQEFTLESLTVLARIFKVLSDKELCDPLWRNLAYKRAISRDDQKSSDSLEYDKLREEVKLVCGPELFTEWTCFPTDLKSGSCRDLHSSLGEGTLKVTLSQGQSETAHSLPSSLQASSSLPSYPTHLEISIPPTASFRSPETSKISQPNVPVPPVNENAAGPSETSKEPQLKSSELSKKHLAATLAAGNIKLDNLIAPTQPTKPTAEPNVALHAAANIILPEMPAANVSKDAEEEEEEEDEEMFYAFVILHAPEDADIADSMKERLERVIGSEFEGATFSDNFATPGRSTLTCVEDAINNTAFTILLLTNNYNTRMQEVQTNSALINSIQCNHKYNTVIPLLPQENGMPKERIPLVLRTLVLLDERRNFERKTRNSMSRVRIKKQWKIWSEEQRVKKQKDRQERLKQLIQHEKQMIKECGAAHVLEEESFRLLMKHKLVLGPGVPPGQVGGDGRAGWQQQPNICIKNARYIMIGDQSRMSVDLGGGADKEDSDHSEEEQ